MNRTDGKSRSTTDSDPERSNRSRIQTSGSGHVGYASADPEHTSNECPGKCALGTEQAADRRTQLDRWSIRRYIPADDGIAADVFGNEVTDYARVAAPRLWGLA